MPLIKGACTGCVKGREGDTMIKKSWKVRPHTLRCKAYGTIRSVGVSVCFVSQEGIGGICP